MTLELIELRPPQLAGRHLWVPPFDHSVAYENHGWWTNEHFPDEALWYLQVLESGREVARALISPPDSKDFSRYGDVPALAEVGLEVERIEVAMAKRNRGVGIAVIKELEASHPEQRLFAFALDEAERFWCSTGWSRHRWKERPETPHDSLFIQSRELIT